MLASHPKKLSAESRSAGYAMARIEKRKNKLI